MRGSKKLIAMLLAVLMVFALQAPVFADGPAFTPGTYTAEATGNGGPLTVAVTFSDGKIESVVLEDSKETAGIGDVAAEKIIASIVDGQTLAVDAIAGATNTSKAILSAIEDCVAQAGGDVEALKVEQEKADAQTIELTADVAVVGSGPSGLAAAVEAAESGLSVVLIEKKGFLGGNVSGTEGMFGYGSQMQADADVELPSLSVLIEEEMAYTNYRSDALLWKNMLSESGANIDWLQAHGVEYDRVDTYEDASLFKCFHWWPNRGGASYAAAMSEAVETLGVEVLLNTPAYKLIEKDGTVCGVLARNTETEDEYVVNAKAVVLCTGGLSNNKELMAEMTGHDTTYTQSQSPSVGDGLRMAVEVGAGTTPVCALNFPTISQAGSSAFMVAYQCLPAINQSGQRFYNESVFAKYFCALMLNALSSQKHSYIFVDQNTIDRFENGEGITHGFVFSRPGDKLADLAAALDEGVANDPLHNKKGETVEELAAAIGADPAVLQATIDRYNELVAKGVDEDFGKDPGDLFEIGAGPYYALELCRYYVTSIGGINIDIDNRVLTAEDEPIPGLYSAGVDSCELYQETYNYQLSGGMMAYNTYSGRNAVRTILKDLAA